MNSNLQIFNLARKAYAVIKGFEVLLLLSGHLANAFGQLLGKSTQ